MPFAFYRNAGLLCGLGETGLPGERSGKSNGDMLMREHRLYQADWLIRKYGFAENEFVFDAGGNLPLEFDPKEFWAKNHPQYFPLNVNRAEPGELLRVPGFGHVMIARILELRRSGTKITSMEQLGSGKRFAKAQQYICFGI